MAEEPQRQSIQDRIAAMNLGHVGRAPITATQNKRPVPQPPMKRAATASIPTTGTSAQEIGNEPASYNDVKAVLPPPEGIVRTGQLNGNRAKPPPPPRAPPRPSPSTTASRPSPALPPRRPSQPSQALTRRESQESIASSVSSMSALSTGTGTTSSSIRKPSMDTGRVRAPAYDPATLPPLPPKRSQTEKEVPRAPLKGRQPSVAKVPSEIKTPARPPALPRRSEDSGMRPPEPPREPARRLPPTTIPPVKPRSVPPRPNSHGLPTPDSSPDSTPPPVPASTKPDLAALLATKPKMPAAASRQVPQPTNPAGSCLICRDFSTVDAHAAKFPRHQVPSLAWLGQQLCGPFPSHTDKARAIFTWLHHNISYNVQDFFSGNLKPSTPESTLSTGLAVCEGYAALFANIATHAGLECVVVGGHGKGFGHTPLEPGQPMPPRNPTGHAWNAVRIDNGAWKLTDPCWGAGAVAGANQPYIARFEPSEFTKSNEDFGWKHFPSNPAHFFRGDGRAQISWDEYMQGPNPGLVPPQAYCTLGKEGWDERKMLPAGKHVSTDARAHAGASSVRFQLERVCVHWDPVRNGKGRDMVYCLEVFDRPGGQRDLLPFANNGTFLWLDVPVAKLGQRGGEVKIIAITKCNDYECRGLGVQTFKDVLASRNYSGGWDYVCAWELV